MAVYSAEKTYTRKEIMASLGVIDTGGGDLCAITADFFGLLIDTFFLHPLKQLHPLHRSDLQKVALTEYREYVIG